MDKVNVTLELFAFLDKYYPPESNERPCRLSLPSNASARSTVNRLELPADVPIMVYVNNKQVPENEDRPLKEGDVLGVMPAVPGG